MDDLFNLQRFVDAQTPVYREVCAELRAGSKRTHWMWFVFPQIAGLGHSPTARFYAIASRAEADAYLAHNVLQARLAECTAIVTAVPNRSANTIFGSPDDVKFRSSMTLFAQVAADPLLFTAALDRFFAGVPGRIDAFEIALTPAFMRHPARAPSDWRRPA